MDKDREEFLNSMTVFFKEFGDPIKVLEEMLDAQIKLDGPPPDSFVDSYKSVLLYSNSSKDYVRGYIHGVSAAIINYFERQWKNIDQDLMVLTYIYKDM